MSEEETITIAVTATFEIDVPVSAFPYWVQMGDDSGEAVWECIPPWLPDRRHDARYTGLEVRIPSVCYWCVLAGNTEEVPEIHLNEVEDADTGLQILLCDGCLEASD